MSITEQALTLEQFLKLPEQKPYLEYYRGRIRQKLSPQRQHSWLETRLPELFNQYAVPRGLAMAFVELRAVFSGVAMVPDVSVYRSERVPFDAEGKLANRPEEPPDIAIEIVSPGQSVTELVEKCLIYIEAGVALVLLIDPTDERVLVFGPGGTVQARGGAERIDFSQVLPGFGLSGRHLRAPSPTDARRGARVQRRPGLSRPPPARIAWTAGACAVCSAHDQAGTAA